MSKNVRFDDQVYIEINNLKPLPFTDKRILCSKGFLNETIYGIRSHDYYHANFRNCIFTIIPSLVDNNAEMETVNSLKTELSLLSINKSKNAGQKYLESEINLKNDQILKSNQKIDSLNRKIVGEMSGKEVSYGEVVLLRHLETGYYLSADMSHHPNNSSMQNLKLQKERNASCYFKFFSYMSPLERTYIDYQSEMKLVSVHLNTVFSLGVMRTKMDPLDLTNNDGEVRNLDKPLFPDDAISRECVLSSFNGTPIPVGTVIESPWNHSVKLIEYCSKEDRNIFAKKRTFKSGDYVRFQVNDFYLTASLQKDANNKDTPSLNLTEQQTEGYNFNNINSIFQIIKKDKDHFLPRGAEIESLQKKASDEESMEQLHIKHFATGRYLSVPQEKLFEFSSQDNDNCPSFRFIHDDSSQHHALTRNSRVSLKVFKAQDNKGTYYLESELEKFNIDQYDLASKAYVGFKNPEQKIKHKIKSLSKRISEESHSGSFFQISKVSDEEIRKILEIEAYADELKRFMKVLQCAIRKDPRITDTIFQNELEKISLVTNNLQIIIDNITYQMQHVTREFRICDILARFLYYFLVNNDIETVIQKAKTCMEDTVQLLVGFSSILLGACKNNQLSYLYVAQYSRMFIRCLLSSSPIYKYCSQEQTKALKDTIVTLLYHFLRDEDLDTFGQIIFYEKDIFRCLDQQTDFSTHLLKVMDHCFKSESPNFDNALRDNFIKLYVSDPSRIRKIFPVIRVVNNSLKPIDFEITVQRESQPLPILLSKVDAQFDQYLIHVFMLIVATAKARSLRFAHIIMEYYTEDTCENLLTSPIVSSNIKNSVLAMLKAVHYSYNKLPFDKVSSKIQMLVSKEVIKKWQTTFGRRIREAENSLISDQEKTILPKRKQLNITKRLSIYELSLDIIKNGNEHINNAEFASMPFVFQVIKGLLQEEDISVESLSIIHISMSTLIEKAALGSRSKDIYYDFFAKNYEEIFLILSEIDRCAINFTYKETLEKIKEQVVNLVINGEENNYTEDPTGKLINALKFENGSLRTIIEAVYKPWKSKEKLRTKAGNSYLEDKVRKSLWTIVENGSSDISHEIMHLIKHKTNFEGEVIEQLSECVLIAEENEMNSFDDLVVSLLNLNKIERKLGLITEFGLTEKENEKTLDDIIENLEGVFTSIYDYETHMQEDNKAVTKEKAREALLHRFLLSKVTATNELPFRYKGNCVKVLYQKIMKTLNAHQIITPFIKHLAMGYAFEGVNAKKMKLGCSLAMAIMMLILYNNHANQNLMSTYPSFINVFYTQEILNFSVESIFMYTEMCRGNARLLELNQDYLFSVAIRDFVGYYQKISTETDKPATLNYIRSLPVILSSKIPIDLFDPANFMMKTFFEFSNIMERANEISLLKRLEPPGVNDVIRIIEVQAKKEGIIDPNHRVISTPLFYIMLKELLESEKIFALTEDKECANILQREFTMDKIIEFLGSDNIIFNFELKQLTLETFENIFINNIFRNLNIFTDYDQFTSFASIMLLDAYAYLKSLLPVDDAFLPRLSSSDHFNTAKSVNVLFKYEKLFEHELDNIVYIQYQSVILLKQAWKKYIFYVLCDIFGHLIVYFKDYMLNTKEKGVFRSSNSIFEAWIKLVLKLRSVEKDRQSRIRLDNVLKNAVIHSEYAHRREMVTSALDMSSKQKLGYVAQTMTKEPTLHEEVNNILSKFVGEQNESRARYEELNLKAMAKALGPDVPVLKKLINAFTRPQMHMNDVFFILKLLRKVIEVENKSEKDELKPIYFWSDVPELELECIKDTQKILINLGVVKALFTLLYQRQDDKKNFKEILLLSIALIFGGNKAAQDAFYQEFLGDSDNEIFTTFVNLLEEVLEFFRIKESHKSHQAYLHALKFLFNNLSDQQKSKSFETIENKFQLPEVLKEKLVQTYSAELKEVKISSQWEDYNLMLIILEFFQNLCEGHHFNFQEFLRDQTIVGHSKSSNIPGFLREAYCVYYKHLNINNVETGVKILDMLIEIQQGSSSENINILLKKTFISDLCNTLVGFNTDIDLLARGFEFNSSHPRFVEIKSKVLIILKDLVEKSDTSSLKQLSNFIDLKALCITFKDTTLAFHQSKKQVLLNNNTFEVADMWDPNLANAFNVYFILKHLSFESGSDELNFDIYQHFEEILAAKPKEQKIINYYLHTFFLKYTGSIEIFQKSSNRLLRIHFPMPPMYAFLKEDTKNEFSKNVDRTNTSTKITGLMDSSVELIGQMTIEYNSRKRLFGLNLNNLYKIVRFVTNIMSLAVVFDDMFGLYYFTEEDDVGEWTNQVGYTSEYVDQVNDGLSMAQACLASALILLWLATKLERFLAYKWDTYCNEALKAEGPVPNDVLQKLNNKMPISKEMQNKVLRIKGPYSEEGKLLGISMFYKIAMYNFFFTLQSGSLLWHATYLGICIGSVFHPLASAFQPFDIIVRSDTVNRIVKSFSRNLKQFLWTFILLLVMIYVYTLVGFFYLHSRYDDADVGSLCIDSYACYMANLSFGLRNGGGIADSMKKVQYDPDQKWYYLGTAIFDLTFFILMITLFLNLIFGMIIDAFKDLRDEKTTNEEDMANTCFICGLGRSEFEKYGRFEDHVTKEHYKWQYIAYLVYLREKAKLFSTEFTDIEDYVADRYKKKDFVWIPIGRSRSLEKRLESEQNERKNEVEKFRDNMEASFNLMNDHNAKLSHKLKEVEALTKQRLSSIKK